MLTDLAKEGHIASFLQSGGRLHQAGCNGCIGMGQAPASGRNSLRTTPRNFPGRSGTREDSVYLSGTETAAASVLTGVITDPRTLGKKAPKVRHPENPTIDLNLLDAPLPYEEAKQVELEKGPNIKSIPEMDKMRDKFQIPILLKIKDNISTYSFLNYGVWVLHYSHNILNCCLFSY